MKSRPPQPARTNTSRINPKGAPPVYLPLATEQAKGALTPSGDFPPVYRTWVSIQEKPESFRSQGIVQRLPSAPLVVPWADPRAAGRITVVQRQLQIADQKEFFDKSAAAEKFLKTEYENVLLRLAQTGMTPRPMSLDEHQRLQEIARVADDVRYVYPIEKLQDVMDYIASGQTCHRAIRSPAVTPERVTDDSDPWGFVLHKGYNLPTQMEVPQTPTDETYFPSSSSSTPFYMDISSDIQGVSDDIEAWAQSSTKSHLGKNHYAYKERTTMPTS
jgi:hypothetical protein